MGTLCARKAISGLTGRRFHLGDNKEVFDAEALAIYQALKTFEARQGARRRYTIFSDCQPAIRRAMTGVLARACIEVGSRLVTAGNEASIVWVPEHSGVEGSEFADGLDKEAAQGSLPHSAPDEVRWQASLQSLSRRASEERPRGASEWIAAHVRPEQRRRPQAAQDYTAGLYARSRIP